MSSVQDLARLQRQMERGAAVGDWLNAESYANEAGVLARELGRYSQSATLHKEQLVFARKTDQASCVVCRDGWAHIADDLRRCRLISREHSDSWALHIKPNSRTRIRMSL